MLKDDSGVWIEEVEARGARGLKKCHVFLSKSACMP